MSKISFCNRRACLLLLWACAGLCAETVPSGTFDTKPMLSDPDLAALRTLFENLGDAFIARDPQKVEALLVGGSERARIMDGVKREFEDTRYLDFHVLEIAPDYRLTPRRHSVDVRLQFQLMYRHEDRPSDAPKIIQNDLTYEFVVHRNDLGGFHIVSSSFFSNLGRHSGGLPGMLANGMLAIMGVLALFVFWIWMSAYALWMRPRLRFWRIFVPWFPPLGALAFFIVFWLPRWLRGDESGERR